MESKSSRLQRNTTELAAQLAASRSQGLGLPWQKAQVFGTFKEGQEKNGEQFPVQEEACTFAS